MKQIISLILILTGICGIQEVRTQPLEFYDIKDSLHLTDIAVHATSDAGWINVALTADSAIAFIKHNYCGDILYIKKFKVDTFALSQLSTSISSINTSDSIYLTCVLQSEGYKGIYCLSIYPYKGDIQYPKICNIPNLTLYENPSLIANNNDRLLCFNAGNDEKDLTGYVIKMDNLFQSVANFHFADTSSVHGILSLDMDGYALSFGKNLLAKISTSLQLDYVYQLDSNFTHFHHNLTSYNNQVAIAGNYYLNPNSSYFTVVKFDPTDGKVTKFNKLVAYNRGLIPKILYYKHPSFGTDNIVITHLATVGNSEAVFSTTRFINTNFGGTQFFKLTQPYTCQTYGLDYLPVENNFALAGSYVDTFRYFSAKLNKNAELTQCFSFKSADTSSINEFQKDTFTRTQIRVFPAPQVFSTIKGDSLKMTLTRACNYFDFKQGTTSLDYCNGVTDTVFVVSAIANDPDSYKNPYVKYKWSTGETTQSIEVRYPYDAVTVEVSYCHEKKTFSYNFNAKDCTPLVEFANVFAPGSDIPENKLYGIVIKEPMKVKSFECKIFNRWGKEVFTTNNLSEEWDGNFSGNPAPADTYSVKVIVLDIYNMTNTYSGMFTLIR